LEIENKWHVVYTRPRWEKKIVKLLQLKNIEHYCPLKKEIKQWSDRKKVIFEPLFRGYVFVKIPENLRWEITKIDGILNYIHWLGKPAIVKDSEIETIKRFLNEFDDVEITENIKRLAVNEVVVIKQGMFMDYKGIVIEVIGNKAKVKIDSLGIALSATFDKKNLIKV